MEDNPKKPHLDCFKGKFRKSHGGLWISHRDGKSWEILAIGQWHPFWNVENLGEFCSEIRITRPGKLTKLLKMAIEIVDFPMKNGGSFHSYVNVYQRVRKQCSFWNGMTGMTLPISSQYFVCIPSFRYPEAQSSLGVQFQTSVSHYNPHSLHSHSCNLPVLDSCDHQIVYMAVVGRSAGDKICFLQKRTSRKWGICLETQIISWEITVFYLLQDYCM